MSHFLANPSVLSSTRLVGCLMAWCLACNACVSGDEVEKKTRVQEDYELMKLFAEVFEEIDTNYVKEIDRRELTEAAIRGMLEHLDQYSTYVAREDVRRFDQVVEQEFGGIGIQVNAAGERLAVVSPLAGSPAFRAGIRSGDVIVEVDGQSTDGFRVADAVKVLQGPPGRPVTLGIRRDGETEVRQIRVVREVIQVPTVLGDRYNAGGEWDFMLDAGSRIGYIRLSHFSRHTVDEMRNALENLKSRDVRGLVLDLRSNPGGLLEAAIEIADLFLESGDIVSIKGRNVSDRSWKAKKSDADYPAFPVAVLVNRFSASASEVLSACLQDNERAVIVGERTWGKGSVQNVIRLESGSSALKLTTASYHRPSGVNIHRFPNSKKEDAWGVNPSPGYEVSLSTEEWQKWVSDREKKDVLRPDKADVPEQEQGYLDPQLAKALDYLAQQLKTPPESSPDSARPAAAETAETASAAAK